MTPGFCALPECGLLFIHGEDAGQFLQGQATCDVHALNPGQTGLGAFCTAKGRVVASFRMFRSMRGYYLFLPVSLVETVAKRLQLYMLRSRVIIENLTQSYGCIGLLLDESPLDRGAYSLDLPEKSTEGVERDDEVIFRLADDSNRYLVAATTDAARRLWSELGHHAELTRCSPNIWNLMDIEEGLPTITPAVSEEFLPQMLNLDILGGISFKKGCYTGQEIVARTHYLGHLKRRLLRFRGHGHVLPQPGGVIYGAHSGDGNCGQVVMAASETDETFQLLAVINLEHMESADLRLHQADGPKLELLSLPYEKLVEETDRGNGFLISR
jgi:folate-binding protein YgfZ